MLVMHENFRHQNFSETGEFPYEMFRYCEKKFFVIPPPPPLLCIIFFDTRNFLKHRRVPLRIFSAAARDKKFSMENRDPPLLHKL